MNLVPDTLTQGNSWKILYKPTDSSINDAAGWSLNLALRGVTDTDVQGVYDVETSTYTISITPTIAQYEPGVYSYFLYLSNVDERVTVEIGNTTVTGDPLTTIGLDLRSHNVKMLEALDAFLERRATNGQIDHIRSVIGDNTTKKELERMSFTELQGLRQNYLRLVKMEQGKFPKGYVYGFKRII